MANDLDKLRKELTFQLMGGNAHAKLDQVVENFPEKHRGAVPPGLPYSAWQILEHMRIAQEDILRFCANSDGSYEEMTFPDDYWPKQAIPSSAGAWEQSIRSYKADLDEFVALIHDPKSDLFATFPWGNGQTLAREAMVLVDHAAYHLGELVAIRRTLNIWPAK